ncbi:MAG TPA: NAD(P)-dependent oxidoreductase, partial [Burkholderiales bacterium]|nr:NAD(P)-dependent oxidoreductase [Burkholderiales bacterium]
MDFRVQSTRFVVSKTTMSVVLVSHHVHARHGATLRTHAERAGMPLELIALPADATARLPEVECERVQAAFFSQDVYPAYSRQFFSAVRKAPQLQWLHVFNAGVDHPIYNEMLERGVRLTTSSGSTAAAIAQTAIAGMLWLARKFSHWQSAQRSHQWAPMRGGDAPRDLGEQTVLIVGLGHIGNEIARLARALHMKVIGVRRSGPQPGDCVDEVHRTEELDALLPHCDWLVIACPLTPETRGMIGAERLALLPRGAHVVNIARGEIVD